MSGRPPSDPDLDFHDLIADPMIRMIMKADGIDERELRELFDRTAEDMKQRREITSVTKSARCLTLPILCAAGLESC